MILNESMITLLPTLLKSLAFIQLGFWMKDRKVVIFLLDENILTWNVCSHCMCSHSKWAPTNVVFAALSLVFLPLSLPVHETLLWCQQETLNRRKRLFRGIKLLEKSQMEGSYQWAENRIVELVHAACPRHQHVHRMFVQMSCLNNGQFISN